ncbi:MAG: arginine--tRNA ligase, partial [Oscillospiraceae bacterium]
MNNILKQVNPILDAKNELNELIMNAIGCAVANGTLSAEPIPAFKIEIPADTKKGDFATNVAMISAKAFHKAPNMIAKAIVDEMVFVGTSFEKAEIAGPGFINFFLNHNWFSNVIKSIDEEKDNYGRTDFGANKKVMVEFVSANPTGPMHIGNARGGAIGDCLASVLDWAGYDVTKEFYVNDAGNQINKFAISLEARYLEIFGCKDEFPEDAYKGEDIITHAKNFAEINSDKFVNTSSEERQKALVDFALPINIANLKTDLARYRINYDVWFLESTLHNANQVEKCIDILTKNGLTYKSDDGALFYKASE